MKLLHVICADNSFLIQIELFSLSWLKVGYLNEIIDLVHIVPQLLVFFCHRKTPKYRTPAEPQHSKSVQRRNLTEKKRLSFNGREETVCVMDKIGCAISLDEGENVEEKLKECLQQLELVSQGSMCCDLKHGN